MHARADNPELIKAIEIGIPVYSFPEFLYRHSRNKKRVVIGGSHGKTTITAMIMHVLRVMKFDFDYMVGAKVQGFDTMVRLSNAEIIILEGDEYLSSPVDRRPKFHLYKADIGLISGIAWDHINVFPTFENYLDQFRIFADNIPSDGSLIYCSLDDELKKCILESKTKAEKIGYGLPEHEIVNGVTNLITPFGNFPLHVFGDHNLMNLEGARNVCRKLGVTDKDFFNSIKDFTGAARRLELLAKNDSVAIYKDFAHSPSKLKATVNSVRHQFPDRKIIACMELHTFSSLNENFLDQYAGSMNEADIPFIYFNPQTVEHKKLKPITTDIVRRAFANNNISVFTDSDNLLSELQKDNSEKVIYLLMSSGNFGGIDLNAFAKRMTGNKTIVEPT
jgi:UDP-N-acetylmuramate: L-alanyl-gamma-D-glutamyl-meso-diaminopimelate ligase